LTSYVTTSFSTMPLLLVVSR